MTAFPARRACSTRARDASSPFIEHIFADGGYQGSQLARRLARTGSWLIEIVKRPDIPRFE
jgi:hypothetical protein